MLGSFARIDTYDRPCVRLARRELAAGSATSIHHIGWLRRFMHHRRTGTRRSRLCTSNRRYPVSCQMLLVLRPGTFNIAILFVISSPVSRVQQDATRSAKRRAAKSMRRICVDSSDVSLAPRAPICAAVLRADLRRQQLREHTHPRSPVCARARLHYHGT